MIDFERKLEEFHIKYKHYIGVRGVSVPRDIIKLRSKLVAEEAREFVDACDAMDVALANEDFESYKLAYILAADALADLKYVVFGSDLAFAVPIDQVFLEVHRSNMTKSTGKNEYGKTIKGPAYRPPQIEQFLFDVEKE